MENLPKTQLWIPSFFLVLQLKNHHLYSCAGIDTYVFASIKRLRWHRHINAFFSLEFNQKGVNQGMISAWQTTNRQSFKKVTCPFKHSFYPFSSRKAYLRSLVGLVACWLRNSRIWQWWHDMTCHNGWPCVLPKSLIKITSNDNDNTNSKIKEVLV